MEPTYIELTQIITDADTQVREQLNMDVVSQYACRMGEGDYFPPVILFRDRDKLYLADGFHRLAASVECGYKSINAIVYEGDVMSARWYAIGANRSNGARLARGDIKRAVEMALQMFPDKSQQQIADHVGCSIGLVNKVKKDIFTNENTELPETRVDTKGRERPTSYKTSKAEPDTQELDFGNESDESEEINDLDDYPPIPESPAMRLAYEAIDLLASIPPSDKMRSRAYHYVYTWICSRKDV